jgi:nucleotide-binding universal stress UspA family protein
MTSLKRILCATDFSPASDPAWDFAQRLAGAVRADLLLVHVLRWIPVAFDGAFDAGTYQRLLDDERREAQARLDRLAPEGGLRVTKRLEDGPPAARILSVAESEGVDLLVVGTHGRTGLNRLLMGSVAEHVVQAASCPVVTVRPLPGAARGLIRPFTRIVYPTDFSPAATRAWPWVRALAAATGAEIDLVHVLIEVVPDRHVDPAFLAQAAQAIRADAARSAEQFLATCGFPRERIHVQFAHGVEADAIVHWAQSRGADVIVMGTHGRTGLLRLALGSVARRVLHAAPCPVLTVGPNVQRS